MPLSDPLTAYVAGASREIERAEQMIAALVSRGLRVSHDWTKAVRQEGTANTGLDDEARRRYAAWDLDGVRGCDVFVLLVPYEPSAGCWVELGFALRASGRHVIFAAGPAVMASIFTALADHCFPTDEEMLRHIDGQRLVGVREGDP